MIIALYVLGYLLVGFVVAGLSIRSNAGGFEDDVKEYPLLFVFAMVMWPVFSVALIIVTRALTRFWKKGKE